MPASCDTACLRLQVVAARDTGLMLFESFKASSQSYYLENSCSAHQIALGPQQHQQQPKPMRPPRGGAAAAAAQAALQHRQLLLAEQQRLKLQQQQQQQQSLNTGPDYHHYSEAGEELDALQRAFEEHPQDPADPNEGESTGGQPAGQQQGAATAAGVWAPVSPGSSSQSLPDAALTPEQQQAQQQVALQLQILEQFAQQQQWMQQQQLWQQQGVQVSSQHSPHSSGSYFERRNRPKVGLCTQCCQHRVLLTTTHIAAPLLLRPLDTTECIEALPLGCTTHTC